MIRIVVAVVLSLAAAGCAVVPPAQTPVPAPLPPGAVDEAVRDALIQGASLAVGQLGRVNGFWSNAAVRVPVPEALARPAEAMRKLGMGAKVDAFHRALNTAAEQSVPYAAELFIGAIRELTLDDARAVLDGGGDAATRLLRERSAAALTARLLPYVQATTTRIGVTQRYKDLLADYGVLLRDSGLRHLDLDAYITQKTIDGVFFLMAAEEARIRRDARARGTERMRQVFGSI
ncbi:DUF4197 domain-containing protein [Sinimarinibacterium thermocellulolyticum]|uniref:DUF4197 family protein n=1 Tax=Sinimarinibacterium thermocellulolyticum TaxID=3170016 RepID=A0ABV2AC25_9GAMM